MEPANQFQFHVDKTSHGIRIDSFLVRQLRNYTRFRMQRIIRAGGAKIERETAPLPRPVMRGETVTVRLLEPPDKLFEAEDLSLDVLYEDDCLIAVNKPAGQIAHPVGKRQTGTLCNALQHHFDGQSRLRGILRPGIVHRLDRMTSGIMVISKTHRVHRHLSIQFQRQQVAKTYLAVVEGHPSAEFGVIDRPIGQIPGGHTILMTTRPDARDPRPARTEYTVLERGDSVSLVQAKPHTGRIHQIRVHFASIGHPVVGDEFYGPFGEIRASRLDDLPADESSKEEKRHLLHAAQVTFSHPETGESTTVVAPLPEEFRGGLSSFRHFDLSSPAFSDTQ